MSGRGIITISDLRARCRVDPASHCWHWLGATSKGNPRIHTLDYARAEKRTMSGPLAAWHIAHGEAPPAWAPLVYRGCMVRDCLNPAHLRLARDLAEIGVHQRRVGNRKGTCLEARRTNIARAIAARGTAVTPDDVVRAIRSAPATTTNRELSKRYGVREQTVSRIRRREVRAGVSDVVVVAA